MSGADDEQSSEDESMWVRRFSFGGFVRVRVTEAFGAGLGGTCWSGGVALARYLADEGGASDAAAELRAARGASAQLSSLELGCGCSGLPSLALAQLGDFAQVTLTERDEECLEALAANAESNAARVAAGVDVAVRSLDWASCSGVAHPDLLLLADVVYGMEAADGEAGERSQAAAAALYSALEALGGEHTIVLLAQMLKPLGEEQCFERALRAGWRRERVGGGGGGDGDDGLGVFRLRRL